MQEDIVAQGFELMLYGMGTVVVFLALLVGVTTAMSRIVGRFFPEIVAVESAGRGPAAGVLQPDTELVAVISAAVQQHRRAAASKKHSQRSK